LLPVVQVLSFLWRPSLWVNSAMLWVMG